MSIKTACFDRRITIGSRKVRVSPPSIQQAVEILHLLQNMKDQEDLELLMELLSKLEWHNNIDILIHLRNEFNHRPASFSRLLQNLLLQGYDPEMQTQKSKDKEDVDSTGVNWKLLLSQYCRAYPGQEPFKVWNEVPFPFFMEMLPEARQEEARQHINAAFESAFAMGGSEEMMESWQKQAGWETEKEKKKKEYEKELSPEEKKKNRNALKQKLR